MKYRHVPAPRDSSDVLKQYNHYKRLVKSPIDDKLKKYLTKRMEELYPQVAHIIHV